MSSAKGKLLARIFSAFMACWTALAILPGPARAEQKSLLLAQRLYQAHRYSEAAPLFEKAARDESACATGYLYEAHCQYFMGHKREAALGYKYVDQHYHNSAEGKTAARYLAAIDPRGNLLQGAIENTAATVSLGYSALPRSSATLSSEIESVPPVMNHPALNKLTVDTVKGELLKLPPSVQGMLSSHRIKICVTPTLIDKFPNLAFREGRGYDGYTYKSCPGMFDNNTIFICERFVNESSNEVEPPIPLGRVSECFYHEVGHAVDGCLGCISSSEAFRHAYYLDMAKIPPDAAGRLSYFMQKSLPGQQECCAEIVAVCLDPNQSRAEDIKTYFPLTLALVRGHLSGSTVAAK